MAWILRLLISLVFITTIGVGVAQNTSRFGKFNNKFYSIDDFGSAAQMFTGCQGVDGNLFFGNTEEILCFNGVSWFKIKGDSTSLKPESLQKFNKAKVTKLFTSASGLTYVGRENNFGYLRYNKKGRIVYEPLALYDKSNEIGNIWNIFENNEQQPYFIAKNKILKYDGKKVIEISLGKNLQNFTCNTAGFLDKGILLVYTPDDLDPDKKKFFYFDFKTEKGTEIKLPSGMKPFNIRGTVEINSVYYIFSADGRVIQAQTDHGNFKGLKESNRFGLLKQVEINSAKLHHKHIYVATESKGVLILDLNGKLIRIIDIRDNLASSSAFDLFHDSENNLWLALDNGLQFYETSSPLTFFDKEAGITERTERFDFKNGVEYIANTTGIHESYEEDYHKKFRPTEFLGEAAFDIRTYETSFGSKTLVVGYSGLFEVDYAKRQKKLIVKEYAWKTFQNPLNKDEFFVGLENSLGKLTLKDSGWEFETVIADVGGNVINLTYLDGNIIFGAENRGVYVYNLSNKSNHLVRLGKSKNFQSQYFCEAFRGRIYVGMEGGLYYLTPDLKSLKPFNILNGKFYSKNVTLQLHRVLNQNDKRLWVVTHNEISNVFEQGWLELKGKSSVDPKKENWSWTSWPFVLITQKKDGLAYDIRKGYGEDIWFSTNKHLYLFNPNCLQDVKKSFKLTIDEIRVNNKPYIYNPYYADPLGNLTYENNTLKFSFHANTFMSTEQIQYRFKLDNYSEWSEWTDLNFAEFQKLFEGHYTLKIQARNGYGFVSDTMSYDFIILAPWYRTWWAYTIYTISFFILIYIIIQLSIQRVKNQNIRLEGIVKERTHEIAQQNTLLEVQKEEIVQKTKDIVDSIVYAKRIQETILPTERLPEMFKDHFVFYRPKDIVSGDFYWARKKGNKAIFSAIDCTGHGVPGALVSIVGNSALLRCVNEHRLTEPAAILDKLREIVIRSFDSKGQNDVKDGMDMSLCTLDLDTLLLKYAGANNECIIIRNKEIFELKADKQPVGQFEYSSPFTQQEFQLQPGDCIYQFTDGFIDQFGGEKGKKLKSRPFKEMLVSLSHLPMDEQNARIKEFFENWKSGYDQIDDVCVFAVKV